MVAQFSFLHASVGVLYGNVGRLRAYAVWKSEHLLRTMEKGVSVIDAGHYGLEHVFVEDLKMILKEEFPELEIYTEDIHFPYQTL